MQSVTQSLGGLVAHMSTSTLYRVQRKRDRFTYKISYSNTLAAPLLHCCSSYGGADWKYSLCNDNVG